jgi:ABC-type branched-subunit amino acid transport system substrate-binding protein
VADRSPTAATLTRRAIERIEDGDIADARLILAEALALDPHYEAAWLWFAHIAEDAGERRFCLEQAAEINPESRAKQELPKLRRVAAVEPPEVADVAPPPPPPGLAPVQGSTRQAMPATPRGRRLVGAGVTLALLLAVALALLTTNLRRTTPIYIAVAGGMSGPAAASGKEMVQSAQLYFDRVNQEGGIAGWPVALLVYDDRNDPEVAKTVAQQIVADGRPLLVIGHTVSSASMAAGPIYAKAGIPAISSTSTADAMTAGNPWYFRTVFDNRTQGFLIAGYIRHILGIDRISVVAGNEDYGKSLSDAVATAFSQEGTVKHRLVIETASDKLAASAADAVKTLRADADPGVIVVAMQADPARTVVDAIKEAGITATILGGDALGSDRFLASFSDLPKNHPDPDALTNGLLTGAPLIMDSLTSESLRWFDAFRAAYGYDPTWRGAATFDAAIAAGTAMRAAEVTGADEERAGERQRVRDALAALDSPEHAVPGLLGPIYFDRNQTIPRSAMFGVARDGQYASAYDQLRPYAPSGSVDLANDLKSGTVLAVDGQMLERQRIVFAGVNLNEIGELDTANPSFYADFFLWFNYTGDDSATDIVFVNAVDPTLTLSDPVRSVDANGTKYRLYRVTGRFKVPFQFQDFPFDRQNLLISFQNRALPSSKLVYAIDRQLLDLTQQQRLQSGSNAAVSINAIPSWEATKVQYYQDSVGSTALMGDPNATTASGGVEFSLFTADVTVTRDIAAFLGKNLLPLILLALVTYVSLFFPHTLTEARVTFGVTGILTAAVLLASVTGVLPQVGYTVAIEWGFYAFIFLCATCIIIGLAGDWLYEQRRLTELRRLDLFSRIYYPAFVLVVVLAYVVRSGGS